MMEGGQCRWNRRWRIKEEDGRRQWKEIKEKNMEWRVEEGGLREVVKCTRDRRWMRREGEEGEREFVRGDETGDRGERRKRGEGRR